MRTLLHAPFDPHCRAVRLTLEEKRLPHRLVAMDPGALDEDDQATLAAVNPAMSLPVLLDETPNGEDAAISPAMAAMEYLDELQPDPPLMPQTAAGRAEVRRLIDWFATRFEQDVSVPLRAPLNANARVGSETRRTAYGAMRWHFDYFEWLLEGRACFAGDRLSLADLTAAAYLSVLDYFGDAPWRDFPETANWYRRMKSRPSLRKALEDDHPGVRASAHYRNLDF